MSTPVLLGAIVSGIAILGTFAKLIHSLIKITQKFDQLERHTRENYDTNKVLCEACLQILIHFRTGNSYESMKTVENKLVQHLAQK